MFIPATETGKLWTKRDSKRWRLNGLKALKLQPNAINITGVIKNWYLKVIGKRFFYNFQLFSDTGCFILLIAADLFRCAIQSTQKYPLSCLLFIYIHKGKLGVIAMGH